jgi:plasmid maintenance system antidote protein VapI
MGLGGTAEAWLAMQAAHDLVNLRRRAVDLGIKKLARRVA